MIATKKERELLTLKHLESLMVRTSDALMPKTIQKVFGQMPMGKTVFPHYLTNDRIRELHQEGIGIISFIPDTVDGIIKQIYKGSIKKELLFPIGSKVNMESAYFMSEMPRKGLCLMSFKPIPESKEKTFMEQTVFLADYIERILPEIVQTNFWKRCKAEISAEEKKLKELPINRNEITSSKALARLKINQQFRPSFNEAFQQLLLYESINRERLVHSIWTKSRELNDDGFVKINYISSLDFYLQFYPAFRGVSKDTMIFFCSIDFLSKIQ